MRDFLADKWGELLILAGIGAAWMIATLAGV